MENNGASGRRYKNEKEGDRREGFLGSRTSEMEDAERSPQQWKGVAGDSSGQEAYAGDGRRFLLERRWK